MCVGNVGKGVHMCLVASGVTVWEDDRCAIANVRDVVPWNVGCIVNNPTGNTRPEGTAEEKEQRQHFQQYVTTYIRSI